MENEQRNKQSKLTVILGLGVNALLALVKTSVGILGQSPALLADGINSTSDVVYYLVVSFFVRAAEKPADDDHPYGHTQYESVGALVANGGRTGASERYAHGGTTRRRNRRFSASGIRAGWTPRITARWGGCVVHLWRRAARRADCLGGLGAGH